MGELPRRTRGRNYATLLTAGKKWLTTIFNKEIQQQRVDNTKSIIVGHLNINSIRNQFISAESIVKVFDFFLILESKLDSTFPMNQFHIFGFKVFRRDRNRFGGGLILYINENIPCRPLNDHPTFPNLELIGFS